MGSATPSTAVRIFVGAVAAIALLLFGAAGGVLITLSADQRSVSEPSPVDVGFAQDMSMHHEQAVTMATLARERAVDPAIRQLAFDIETNQRKQTGRMQGWLSLWGQPPQSSAAPMQWMQGPQGHGHGHGMAADHSSPGRAMPGMATSEELSHLRSLQGPEFDIEFLQLMLRHHEGGAGMAEYGRDHAAVPAVQQLAANMLGSQGTESMLMRRLLAERGASPLPLS